MQLISVVWLTVHFYSSENPKEKSEDLTFGTSNRIFLPWLRESSSIQSFNFSHNTVILVAMSDTWGINSPNTGDDKFFFPRWGNLHYVMKVDVMMMCFIFLTKTIHLFCIRYVATIHATHPPLLNAKICYFSSQHSTLTALGLIFVIMSILNGKA